MKKEQETKFKIQEDLGKKPSVISRLAQIVQGAGNWVKENVGFEPPATPLWRSKFDHERREIK
jgi:hypothetical protein